MSGATAERILKLVFRIEGVLVALALVAVFLPFETMGAMHRRIGLGELPRAPIVDYLARSLSLFYAAQAPLYFLAASDLRRFRPLALYLGCFHLVLGVAVTVIDLRVGLPGLWTWSEGPPTIAIGLLVLFLLGRVTR